MLSKFDGLIFIFSLQRVTSYWSLVHKGLTTWLHRFAS
jgi:hypothetical protein